eukprot:TRINITY_DN121293_c0_g1_i1.p1 TRINITY_DN121293_c0_g1~~TRINITY_DN121293_c0_g1_i1.p1  ORF type:complete len:506 (+),score=55.64 TRINITY_DN121293_c0_g1_i1:98-1519(+)
MANLYSSDKLFVPVLGGLMSMLLVLYAVGARYGDVDNEVSTGGAQIARYYQPFLNVSIMIFVGFGFLVTFLYKYSFSAVSYNFMIACFVYLWNILCAGFWENVHEDDHHGHGQYRVFLNMPLLVEGLFGAGAVLISFGAVVGRTTPTQLLVMAFVEVIFYSLNFYVGALELKAKDSGGSMFVHAYGAYFGLACSFALTKLSPKHASANSSAGHIGESVPQTADKDAIELTSPQAHTPPATPAVHTGTPDYNGSRTITDITAMIGTLFLWIMWPSFNGALAADGGQLRVVINTTLSLSASCLGTFLMSAFLGGKFDMVHIQNATLAGGVAIGTAADLYTEPAGALLIGLFASLVSVFGYHFLSPLRNRTIGLEDTAGVHNLHGMPGLIGGLSGIIVVAAAEKGDYGLSYNEYFADRSPSTAYPYQIYALLVTFFSAIAAGLITGALVSRLPTKPKSVRFSDEEHWEVPNDFHTL